MYQMKTMRAISFTAWFIAHPLLGVIVTYLRGDLIRKMMGEADFQFAGFFLSLNAFSSPFILYGLF